MFFESDGTVSRRRFLKIAGTAALAGSLPLLSGCRVSLESLAGELGELARLINQYRREQRPPLPAIPISTKLTCVAIVHVFDLAVNHPDLVYQTTAERALGRRPLHSWTPVPGRSGGHYDSADSSTWPIMWDKPREIAGYSGRGYENASFGASSAANILSGWATSEGHRNVILNRGDWSSRTWRALGAFYVVTSDYSQRYGCAWFGEEYDPESIPG